MSERIPAIMERQEATEREIRRLEEMVKSSVDDIKATIRSEIRDLKDEQIADLKAQVKAAVERGDQQAKAAIERVERMAERVMKVERRQDQWATSAGVVNWLIRASLAIGGLVVGILGGQHIK